MISNIFMKSKRQFNKKNHFNEYRDEELQKLRQKNKQKSIKSYCQAKKHISQQNCNQKNHTITQRKLNDQNSSYLSNQIDKQYNSYVTNILSYNNSEKTQKLDILSNKVINLKKKIKKCIPTYSQRQKIRLIEKNQKRIISSKQDQYIVQQKEIQFTVFKDTQVFQSQKNKALRNIIVAQRVDNDTQTDDQQLQKFFNKVKITFLNQMQRYNQQSNSDSSSFQLLR